MLKFSVNQKLENLNVAHFSPVHVEFLSFLIYPHALAQQSEKHRSIFLLFLAPLSLTPEVFSNVISKTKLGDGTVEFTSFLLDFITIFVNSHVYKLNQLKSSELFLLILVIILMNNNYY